jgi:competence protein ComEC
LLAGVFAPQLISFPMPGGCIPLVFAAAIMAAMTGRVPTLLLFAAGAALFIHEAENIVDRRMSAEFVGDSIMTTVRVTGFPRARERAVSFEGEVANSPWVPRRVRVTWQDPAHDIRLGDLWRLELRLKRPRGTSNPGAFDYERWLFRERIAAVGFVVEGGRNRQIGPSAPGPVDRLRQAAVDRLVVALPDRERAAVLAAISVGTRHLVQPERWERYARTGTSHLMAISGLHVGMVAAVAYVLAAAVVVPLGGSRHQHRIGTAVAFAAACSYGALSGFAVPAQRATTMIGLAAIALAVARPVRAFRVLAVTSSVVAICDPLATLSPGFVLSFLAVLLLIWLARQRPPAHDRQNRLAQLLRVQLALLLGLLPATVVLFGRFAVTAPIANLIAVPVFSAITVPFTLLGLLLDGPVRPVGDVVLAIAAWSLGVVESLIDICLALPAPDATVPALRGWRIVLLSIPAIWIALPAGWPGRGAAWIAALALAVGVPARPQPGCAEVTVMDVGQGLSVSVMTHSSSLLYDTGPVYFSGQSAATRIVVPYLERLGLRELDHLVVSHADLDHAGGLPAILGHFTVRHIHAGDGAGGPWLTTPCVAGRGFTHDRVRFEFLHPEAAATWTGNDASCVLQISAGARRLLLTGDIEQAAEERLTGSGRLLPVDVLIVPHHGSRTSSTAPFLHSVRPTLAIVSAGYGNRWGQPEPGVVERLRADGATVLNTATSGAISLRLCEYGISQPVANRTSRQRIWHE